MPVEGPQDFVVPFTVQVSPLADNRSAYAHLFDDVRSVICGVAVATGTPAILPEPNRIADPPEAVESEATDALPLSTPDSASEEKTEVTA
jgi:hypothetical protein